MLRIYERQTARYSLRYYNILQRKGGLRWLTADAAVGGRFYIEGEKRMKKTKKEFLLPVMLDLG